VVVVESGIGNVNVCILLFLQLCTYPCYVCNNVTTSTSGMQCMQDCEILCH
jgi:hypothetical protein